MKATLLALVIAVFGITTAIHATEPTTEGAPAVEGAAPKVKAKKGHGKHHDKKEHKGAEAPAAEKAPEAAPAPETK